MKRIRLRWRLKQLLPFTYTTVSRPVLDTPRRYQVTAVLNLDADSEQEAVRIVSDLAVGYCGSITAVHKPRLESGPELVRWRMWLGHCFGVARTPC